jgi:hypothetical protein
MELKPPDLILRSALLRASRRMDAGTISRVAVLRDGAARLLRTRLIDDIDIVRASETLY